jgi:hypothetical protein
MNTEKIIIYDIELYPNIFTCVLYSVENQDYITYEISERVNDFDDFAETLMIFGEENWSMVGFNNLGYDYPVLHTLLNLWKRRKKQDWKEIVDELRHKSDSIIHGDFEDRFKHIIYAKDQYVSQIDLFKVHHFDNIARATSLKALEFKMKAHDIGDLPYDPEEPVPLEGFDKLIEYNKHDVDQTYDFFKVTIPALELRLALGKKYGRDFINHNDTKIGKDIFIMELEDALGKNCCYDFSEAGRTPRQTKRSKIDMNEIIFDYVNFTRPEFKAMEKWIRKQTIRETKGVFTEINFEDAREFLLYADKQRKKGRLENANVIVGGQYRDTSLLKKKTRKYVSPITGGLKFIFGTGGLHASMPPSMWRSNDDKVIIDVDVTSYYPSLAIENNIYPEHLGPKFCAIYDSIKEQRVAYAKGTPENAALKLALNGVYGDSNNQYSPFYDPKYTMAITVNGQLSLCMLSEMLLEVEDLQIIQVNTDGVTAYVDRNKIEEFNSICNEWQKITGLELEEARYEFFALRDVNNYFAKYENGDVKRKGEFEYNVGWHQNHSMKVVAKAVEAYLLHGTNIESFIKKHEIAYDFYILGKCDRSSRLLLRTDSGDEYLQRNNRYYASTIGGEIIKVMPPVKKRLTKKLLAQFKKLGAEFDKTELSQIEMALNEMIVFDIAALRSQGETEARLSALELCQPKKREISQCKESLVTIHNHIEDMIHVNYDYYLNKALKLISEIKLK